jgi:2-polyprenyl-3-methyl-5-hydroxy-6-metoxy-1,4-benzoquinol methylase
VSDQIFANWEAIVVDDGSTDDTANIVTQFVTRDPRFRLEQQSGVGASRARNRGIELANFDHLLFLDADDTIFPAHLAYLSQLLLDDPQLDASVCGWAHATPVGELVFEQCEGEQGDLFRAHAQYCYSLIHTYLSRRSIVEEAGGFDSAFNTCEDWDLFQRVARLGARFGRVPEVLASYRMRAGSATSNVTSLLHDGLKVLRNGHAPDERIKDTHPVYGNGLPAEELPLHAYGHACTCAGYFLGMGLDAVSTLDPLPGPPPATFRPIDAAHAILVHAIVAAARPKAEWASIWIQAQPNLREFLETLEARLGLGGFAHKTEQIADYLLQRSLGKKTSSTLRGAMHIATDRVTHRLTDASKFVRRTATSAFRSTSVLERPGLFLKRVKMARQSTAAEDLEAHFEALFRESSNPWQHESAYETTKVRQTLNLLPDVSDKQALEVGCGEGYMTRQIAARVKDLVAIDISSTALERAARRCDGIDNVEFRQLNFVKDSLGGRYDLIVCSEVLYYCPDRAVLRNVARQLAASLRSGGLLLLAHANLVIDDPERPGFNWGQPFGAKVIGEVFAQTEGLKTLREAHAPLYRIHLLQRIDCEHRRPAIEELAMPAMLTPQIARDVYSGASWNFPIITYPGIVPDSADGQSDHFADQMCELHMRGYRTQSFETWKNARDYGVPIAGKAVHIIFDHPSRALVTAAQPVLSRLGFVGTCILTVDPLSGRLVLPTREKRSDCPSWRDLRRLQAAGMTFGVRIRDAVWHENPSLLNLLRLITRAREIASAELAVAILILRVPGTLLWNRRLQWIAGASGFQFAVCARTGVAVRSDRLLALPTVEASVSQSPGELLAHLGSRTGDSSA